MDYFKKIERSVTISADKRSTVDLQVDVWSQDLNVTKFILKLDTTDSAAIDLTNATVRVAMVYSQDGKDVKIEAAGIVEDVATQKIAYIMSDRLAGFEGQVTAGFYVTLSTGQRIDIQNVTFNMRKSLLDKDLEAAKESYYQTFDDIVADVQSEGEKAKTEINQVLPNVQAEGEKVKTNINAVVSNVNGYADTQKQAIDNIVSDVQSTGDTAKADIKATLPTLQTQVSQLSENYSELKEDLEYLGQTNSSFNFIKFKMGFIDYYGVESASNTRAVSDYIPGNAIFKIYNPLNVPTTWHFYDANKKHLGVTKSDYPTKEIRYLDMTDYAYFRLVTKENDNPTKSNTISCKKINPTDEVKQIQNVSSVAHQGYSVTERFYGDSRLSSYRGAKDAGFSDAETDILWTSDGIPVCCHEKTFVDATTRETITISEHTLSELKEYNYYGEKICSFEEIINECKKLGLVLHIDHANEFIQESQFTILLNIVKKYQMQNYVWWASAHETHVRMMLNIFPYANIARAVDKTWLDANLVALEKIHNDFPNAKLCIEQNYTEFSTDYTLESLIAKIPSYIGLCLWNVNDIDLYAKYFPYVSAMSSDKISYPMYAMRKIYCEKN